MALQFDRESVDLVESCVAHSRLEHIQMFQVMRVVPVDNAQFEVRPVFDLALREPKASTLWFEQLNEGLHAIKQAGQAVRCDADRIRRDRELVGLLRKSVFIPVSAVRNGYGIGSDGEIQYTLRTPAAWPRQHDPVTGFEFVPETLDRHVVRRNARPHAETPIGSKTNVAVLQLHPLRHRQHRVATRVEWRSGFSIPETRQAERNKQQISDMRPCARLANQACIRSPWKLHEYHSMDAD